MSSAGQIVGGAVGFFLGGPLGIGAAMGAQAGIMLGGLIDPPKQPTIHGPRLNDLSVQTSTTDAPIPRIYGTMATFGNIIWVEGDRLKESVKKTKSGGKGGGGQTTKTYSYSATFAVGLCKGPIAGVRRIWVGARLIYDAGSEDLEAIIASNQAASGFRVYVGSETQNPDPRMQADKGVGSVPAYRGLAYIVFYDLGLAEYGNSLMGAQVKVEVVKSKTSVNQRLDYFLSPRENTASGTSYDGALQNVSSDFRLSIAHPAYGAAGGYTNGNVVQRKYFFGSFTQTSTALVSTATTTYGLNYDSDEFVVMRDTNQSISVGNDRVFYKVFNATTAVIKDGILYDQDFNVNPTRIRKCVPQPRGGANGSSVVATSQTIPDQYTASRTRKNITISDDHVFFVTQTKVFAFLKTDLSLDFEFTYTFPGGGLRDVYYAQGLLYAWYNPVGAQNRVLVLDVALGQQVDFYDLDADGLSIGEYPTIYVNGAIVVLSAVTSSSAPSRGVWVATYSVGKLGGNQIPLSSIVQSETLQSKLILEQDINTSTLTDQVRGYRVATPSAIRADIEPLQLAWPFDVVQRGYKLHFIRRPKTNAATVTEIIGKFKVDREMDIQLLREVALKYVEADREYDVSQQIAKRENTDAINRKDIDLPIVMTASEALQKAEILLYMWWLERYDLTFKLPPIYNNLEASDVITINTEFGTYEVRLTEVTYNADGTLDCKAKYNSANVYTSDAVADTGTSQGSSLQLSGPTLYQVVDMPLVADALDGPGVFMMASGYTTGWPGGTVIRSSDNGATWDEIQGFTQPCAMGFARGTIGAATSAIVDTTSSLQVDMVTGQLESVDHLQLLAGANAFAYGADGRWEIIFAQNCVLQGDGSYILTNFLRGRAGTERNMANHAAGDALISLTDPDIAFVPMNTAQIGISKLYRGITIGRTIDTDTDKALTYHGVNLKPLAPVYLNGHRHPSTNDWTLTWIRRGRVSPEWRDLVDVPVGEATQAFEIEVWNAAYTTLYRTLTAATPTVNYTSAQQVTDFGSNQSTLHVRIFQMSASVGRGFPLQTSITR